MTDINKPIEAIAELDKELLYKCIELRKMIAGLTIGEAKRVVDTLPHELRLALLIGLSITSVEELKNK